jgi:hypothetical protein
MLLSIAGAVTAAAVVFLAVNAERERRVLAREVQGLREQLARLARELRGAKSASGTGADAAPRCEAGRAAPRADGTPRTYQARPRILH